MSVFLKLKPKQTPYKGDFKGTIEELEQVLKKTCTIYVGDLHFYTREEQIHELFSRCGKVKRIIMGLNRFTYVPCGFCFIEYYNHEDANDAVNYLNGAILDGKALHVALDYGYEEGREYGRGAHGGQKKYEKHKFYKKHYPKRRRDDYERRTESPSEASTED